MLADSQRRGRIGVSRQVIQMDRRIRSLPQLPYIPVRIRQMGGSNTASPSLNGSSRPKDGPIPKHHLADDVEGSRRLIITFLGLLLDCNQLQSLMESAISHITSDTLNLKQITARRTDPSTPDRLSG